MWCSWDVNLIGMSSSPLMSFFAFDSSKKKEQITTSFYHTGELQLSQTLTFFKVMNTGIKILYNSVNLSISNRKTLI